MDPLVGLMFFVFIALLVAWAGGGYDNKGATMPDYTTNEPNIGGYEMGVDVGVDTPVEVQETAVGEPAAPMVTITLEATIQYSDGRYSRQEFSIEVPLPPVKMRGMALPESHVRFIMDRAAEKLGGYRDALHEYEGTEDDDLRRMMEQVMESGDPMAVLEGMFQKHGVQFRQGRNPVMDSIRDAMRRRGMR